MRQYHARAEHTFTSFFRKKLGDRLIQSDEAVYRAVEARQKAYQVDSGVAMKIVAVKYALSVHIVERAWRRHTAALAER
jgi:hypothetical protein